MSQPTVCQRLFNDLFIVGLPNKFLWSDNHIKRLPGLHSEDSDVNKIILNEVTYVPRTIVAMVMLYDKGIEVQFKNRRDMYTAYDLITKHLNRWGELISHPLGGRKPPRAEELLMLEDFANFIFEDATFERATLEAEGVRTQTDFLSDFFATFGGRESVRKQRQGIIETTGDTYSTTPVTPQQIQPGSTIQTAWNNSPWSLISGNSRNSG